MRLIDDEADQSPAINIVPMIDVIFAILTFFIMSTLYLNHFEGLPVNLPQAATGQAQLTSPVTVTITAQGQLAVNGQGIAFETLQAFVTQLKGQNPELVVIINADSQATHGQVVAVMDQLRAIPGVKLAIATRRNSP